MHFIILLIAATVLIANPVVGPKTRVGKDITTSLSELVAGSNEALENMYNHIKTYIYGLHEYDELTIEQFMEFVGDSNTDAVQSYLNRTGRQNTKKVNINLFKILMPELNRVSPTAQENALVFTSVQLQDLRRRKNLTGDFNFSFPFGNISPANSST
ncbi:uncharacterized protein LOC126835152 [Adelges cooleyi]|uniref:uncharacterized protein LOC126835152 n=1 Tax=Adelges cooleyi TaxID=133065 RepID=UPI00217FD723|nr:uncharacterized protein LOC126835152 [Adelges cooleyi]